MSPKHDSTTAPAPIRYRPGDRIPALAVYRVLHSPHRADHFCVLRSGEYFPRCSKCADAVRFEITTIETFIAENNSLFHTTRVFEIPHPEPLALDSRAQADDKSDDDESSAAG